jgi:hypothetical protein
MMGDMNWGAGMMAVMSVVSLIVVVGVFGGLFLLVRSLSGQRKPAPPNQR